MKVKVFTLDVHVDDGYDSYPVEKLGDGVSEWEDLSDQEYKDLVSGKAHLEREMGRRLIIARQEDVRPMIKSIRDELRRIKAEQEEKRKKKEERAKINAEKKARLKMEAELKVLEELKTKYGK